MRKQNHLHLPLQISSQEFQRIWESPGCARDVLFLHTAWTLQKTDIPYLHTNIHLKADLGGEGQKSHEGYIYGIKEKLLSGTDLTPSQNTFLSLTPIPLQGFSACSVVIHHLWPWQETAPPWLLRLYCYCGRTNGAGIETKTRGDRYGILPSDRQQSRAMSIPGSSRQSTGWQNNFSE